VLTVVLAGGLGGPRIALRTAGSTGAARAVVRTPASWSTSFPHVAEQTGLTSGSALWLPGPLSSTMNLFAATLARWCGARPAPGPADATHAHLTPLQLARLLDQGVVLAGLHVTVAGERLTRGLRDRATANGMTVDHYYGAAELSFVGWGTCEEDLRPFPGAEVEVRNDVIWVRSPYLCDGYSGPPGALRRDDRGFASVGDRGTFEAGVLRVWGRGSVAVTTGGATVLVADVESALAPVVGGQLAVIGTPHPALGGVVTAVLTRATDLALAYAAACERLAPELRPRRWFGLPELPMTAAGKVDRPRLADQVAEGTARRLTPHGQDLADVRAP
jgi:acyl-CoA synthetase (AMP-forming)/AMP-acid ligase II